MCECLSRPIGQKSRGWYQIRHQLVDTDTHTLVSSRSAGTEQPNARDRQTASRQMNDSCGKMATESAKNILKATPCSVTIFRASVAQ